MSVSCATVMTRKGTSEATEGALCDLLAAARAAGVTLRFDAEETRKHGLSSGDGIVVDAPPSPDVDVCVVAGVASSGLPGPSGNRETFLWLADPSRAPVADLAAAVAGAV